ncbi:MAG: hypothetical protein FD123_1137 [Bacteroidetes bacterium]|nr:MAG: hypothetical protein FD123_1137 [Bacteroidota bacterium]
MLITADAGAQCAMCKAVVESDGSNGGSIISGINDGILYLMAVPYLLLFLFFRKRIIGLFREIRGMWR